MTDATDTLLTTLHASDMLLIDGLHAYEFSVDDQQQLLIKCIDGRAEKRWSFSAVQVQAATFEPSLQSWTLTGDTGEHRLVCFEAITGDNNDEEDEHDDA